MGKQNTSAVTHTSNRGWTALVAALTLALVLTLTACSREPETGEVEPYPPPDPLFYEVANADGEVEGWLLGTIHALPEGVLWRTYAIEEATQKADLLIVEVATLGQGDTIRQAFIELSQSPGLPPLVDRVSPELRADAEAMVERSNLSRAQLRTSEDWAAAIMLAQVDAPGEPEFGVDRALIADFQGRKIIGFEAAGEQLGIFDQLAPEDQRALLEGTIEEWASTQGSVQRLLRAWISGDEAVLEGATTEGIMSDPELRAALLVKRNVDWMAQLLPILSGEPKPIIAVGAAHLVGPDGLVFMLKDAGYTVTRLSAP